jgi:NitT/TauT family transport system ATP-binding protein
MRGGGDKAMMKISGLNKQFMRNGEVLHALLDINLDIYEGEFLVLVGPSGCGKTTFLRIVQGLLDKTSGRIELYGEPITRPSADRGFVFQQDNLYPWRTVLKNTRLGLELAGVDSETADARAREMIRLVGLVGFENSYPRELSGGMRQRVNLARALTIDPKVLLMDEPFAALDAITREAMQTELLRIWREAGKTVMFVTHQIDEAVYLANRVVVMAPRPGRIEKIVTIHEGDGRSEGFKRTPEFHAFVDEIREIIDSHAGEAVA